MSNCPYIHLHNHTEFSLLDGAIRIRDIIKKAIKMEMPAVAITDHGSMYGIIDFYLEAQKQGIKPIIGVEIYVAPGDRQDRTSRQGGADTSHHLILLARNMDGYRNLLKLVSEAHLTGMYYKPRIDKKLLADHSQGLIGMSACLKGEIPILLKKQQPADAARVIQEYQDMFGREYFFLELMDHGIEEQKLVNEELIRFSKKYNAHLIATNDCHYLEKEDSLAHELLLCVQTRKTLADPSRMKLSTDQFYFKSPEEMCQLFSKVPEALENTLRIASECDLKLVFDQPLLPRYDVPEGETLDESLEKLARNGLETRFSELDISNAETQSRYMTRLEQELETIKKMGFPGYFLIVWDFINFARKKNIPVGPGRGSAVGSLVSYSLRITDLDPIRYGLLFERFLNPSRVTLPDIDIDFCGKRRDEVIHYVTEKYHKENVAKIATFGTMAARNVIRDVGRSMDIPYAEVDRIAKLIPAELKITLQDAEKQEPRLRDYIQKDERIRNLFDISKKLEGLSRHMSTHAAGVVISPLALTEFVPLCYGTDNEVTTQYTMKALEKLGLLKIDFLGLKTLTVLCDTIDLVLQSTGKSIDLAKLPMDDRKTFDLLSAGRTIGVFQLESSGMQNLLKKAMPTSFNEIIALVALYRPGPMNMLDSYIQRKHGKAKIVYDHPDIEGILKETFGVMIYQEQVMQIAGRLAGFSMAQADTLRRAMGKKITRVMNQQKELFIEGCIEHGIHKTKASKIFDDIAEFAKYGFNKSHAAAYALIAYQTAYLKAHYPHQFMAALLTNDMDNTDKVVKYINDCKDMGIPILPPDVNESERNFVVRDNAIRFGLAAVKNVGVNAIDSIIEIRNQDGRFTGFIDFCERIDPRVVNRRVFESLIKCGCFDSLNEIRSRIMSGLDNAIEHAQKKYQDRLSGQLGLFDTSSVKEEAGALMSNIFPDIPEWSQSYRLQLEKEALGFYITGHPLAKYSDEIQRLGSTSTAQLVDCSDGDNVSVAGIITSIKIINTKNGDHMAFLQLEDLHGLVEVIVLPEPYKKCSRLLMEDKPVLVKGILDLVKDSPKIKALEIFLLDRLRENTTRAIRLKMLDNRISRRVMKDVAKIIFNAEHGHSKVYIDMLFADNADFRHVEIAVGKNLKLRPSVQIQEQLAAVLGEENVIFC